jgi:glycosidase
VGGPRGYPRGELILRFLNNNDTGRRFAERHGAGVARAAAALLLGAPGIPLVYMGDEVGARFDPYSLAEPLDWRDRHGLRADYRRLIALRGELRSLQGHAWRPVWRGPGSTFALLRPARGGGPAVLVAVNFGKRPAAVRLDPAALPASLTGPGPVRDLLARRRLAPLDPADPRLRVPGFGARFVTGSGADSLGGR